MQTRVASLTHGGLEIILIPHTEATHHLDDLVGGWHDSALTAKGRQDACCLLDKVRRYRTGVESIFSSDLRRARETAEVFGEGYGLSVLEDTRLREISFGVAEGKENVFLREIIKPYPEDAECRMHHRICEGAETRTEFGARLYSFMQDVDKLTGTHLIVTHGFAITFLVAAFMHVPLNGLGYASVQAAAGDLVRLTKGGPFSNRTVHIGISEL